MNNNEATATALRSIITETGGTVIRVQALPRTTVVTFGFENEDGLFPFLTALHAAPVGRAAVTVCPAYDGNDAHFSVHF